MPISFSSYLPYRSDLSQLHSWSEVKEATADPLVLSLCVQEHEYMLRRKVPGMGGAVELLVSPIRVLQVKGRDARKLEGGINGERPTSL